MYHSISAAHSTMLMTLSWLLGMWYGVVLHFIRSTTLYKTHKERKKSNAIFHAILSSHPTKTLIEP